MSGNANPPQQQLPYNCSLCNVQSSSFTDFSTHLKGEQHSAHIRTRTVKDATTAKCVACNQNVFGERNGWQIHVNSTQHTRNAAKVAGYVTPTYEGAPTSHIPRPAWRCSPCNIAVFEHRWKFHADNQTHLQNVTSYRPNQTQPAPPPRTPNAPGPSSSQATATPAPPPQPQPQTVTGNPNIRRCEACNIELHVNDWDKHVRGVRHRGTVGALTQPRQPRPDQSSQRGPNRGGPRGPGFKQRFWIGSSRNRGDRIEPGVPPSPRHLIPWKGKLDEYPIPDVVDWEAVRNFPEQLNLENYVDAWELMMQVEEIALRDNLKTYDQHGVELKRHGPYFHVRVPGLAEKRPSVMVGDIVDVRPQGARDDDPWFEGYVHYIWQLDVGLRFSSKFRPRQGDLYNVRFELSRINARRMYQALYTPMDPDNARRLLFPEPEDFQNVPTISEPQLRELRPLIDNMEILDNPRQLLAVAAIKERPAGSPPLIIWGPPGTGKTVTAVEGIKQILIKDPNARILACAPSNSAADSIAESLIYLGNEKLFRLNAPSRLTDGKMPSCLDEFCVEVHIPSRYPSDSDFFGKDEGGLTVFGCHPKVKFMEFNVIVSTAAMSGVAAGIGVPRGHFTHILIDEAAQALEPEVMIGIRSIADSKTNIILCGDHKQLRPVAFSSIAKRMGYAKSYLERLVTLPGFNNVSRGSGLSMVRLNRNFRSHPAIIRFPSLTVYDGELQSYGAPDIITMLEDWEKLPKKGFPVVFHAVNGVDLQDPHSPSWYNMEEVNIVVDYARALLSDSARDITVDEIGIIAPYQAQCKKIRRLLHPNDAPEDRCKIGSVEEFQGDERPVIIVSTVRSNQGLSKRYDQKHQLGFVAQESRLNVSITRAMALLVIVGNPTVLGTDPLWREFLNFVYLQGGWSGTEIGWDPREEVP